MKRSAKGLIACTVAAVAGIARADNGAGGAAPSRPAPTPTNNSIVPLRHRDPLLDWQVDRHLIAYTGYGPFSPERSCRTPALTMTSISYAALNNSF